MGDKSPKSKQRSEKQRSAAKAGSAAAAKSKQDGFSRPQPSLPKARS